ncbi:hypothetical protein ACOMHN_036724 [Nucella lapillus]
MWKLKPNGAEIGISRSAPKATGSQLETLAKDQRRPRPDAWSVLGARDRLLTPWTPQLALAEPIEARSMFGGGDSLPAMRIRGLSTATFNPPDASLIFVFMPMSSFFTLPDTAYTLTDLTSKVFVPITEDQVMDLVEEHGTQEESAQVSEKKRGKAAALTERQKLLEEREERNSVQEQAVIEEKEQLTERRAALAEVDQRQTALQDQQEEQQKVLEGKEQRATVREEAVSTREETVNAREEGLDGKEEEQKAREEQQGTREEQQNQREQALEQKAGEQDAREEQQTEKETKLNADAAVLQEKEDRLSEQQTQQEQTEKRLQEYDQQLQDRETKLGEDLKASEEKREKLDEREQTLNDKEQQLEQKATELTEKENLLNQEQTALEEKQEQTRQHEEELEQKEQTLKQETELVREREVKVEGEEKRLEEKGQQMQEREETLKQQEKQMEDLQTKLTEEEERLNNRETSLNDMETALNERNEKLNEQENTLTEKEKALEEENERQVQKPEELEQKEEALSEKERSLNEMEQSLNQMKTKLEEDEEKLNERERGIEEQEQKLQECEARNRETEDRQKVEEEDRQTETECGDEREGKGKRDSLSGKPRKDRKRRKKQKEEADEGDVDGWQVWAVNTSEENSWLTVHCAVRFKVRLVKEEATYVDKGVNTDRPKPQGPERPYYRKTRSMSPQARAGNPGSHDPSALASVLTEDDVIMVSSFKGTKATIIETYDIKYLREEIFEDARESRSTHGITRPGKGLRKSHEGESFELRAEETGRGSASPCSSSTSRSESSSRSSSPSAKSHVSVEIQNDGTSSAAEVQASPSLEGAASVQGKSLLKKNTSPTRTGLEYEPAARKSVSFVESEPDRSHSRSPSPILDRHKCTSPAVAFSTDSEGTDTAVPPSPRQGWLPAGQQEHYAPARKPSPADKLSPFVEKSGSPKYLVPSLTTSPTIRFVKLSEHQDHKEKEEMHERETKAASEKTTVSTEQTGRSERKQTKDDGCSLERTDFTSTSEESYESCEPSPDISIDCVSPEMAMMFPNWLTATQNHDPNDIIIDVPREPVRQLSPSRVTRNDAPPHQRKSVVRGPPFVSALGEGKVARGDMCARVIAQQSTTARHSTTVIKDVCFTQLTPTVTSALPN